MDVDAVDASLFILSEFTNVLQKEFSQLTGIESPTQRDKTLNWVRNNDVDVADLRKILF